MVTGNIPCHNYLYINSNALFSLQGFLNVKTVMNKRFLLYRPAFDCRLLEYFNNLFSAMMGLLDSLVRQVSAIKFD